MLCILSQWQQSSFTSLALFINWFGSDKQLIIYISQISSIIYRSHTYTASLCKISLLNMFVWSCILTSIPKWHWMHTEYQFHLFVSKKTPQKDALTPPTILNTHNTLIVLSFNTSVGTWFIHKDLINKYKQQRKVEKRKRPRAFYIITLISNLCFKTGIIYWPWTGWSMTAINPYLIQPLWFI